MLPIVCYAKACLAYRLALKLYLSRYWYTNFTARQMVPKCEAGPEGIGLISGDVNECTNVTDYSELKRKQEVNK